MTLTLHMIRHVAALALILAAAAHAASPDTLDFSSPEAEIEARRKAEIVPCDVCGTVGYYLCDAARRANDGQITVDIHTILHGGVGHLASGFGGTPKVDNPSQRPLSATITSHLNEACNEGVFFPKSHLPSAIIPACAQFVTKHGAELLDYFTTVHRKGFDGCVTAVDMFCTKIVKKCDLFDTASLPSLEYSNKPQPVDAFREYYGFKVSVLQL